MYDRQTFSSNCYKKNEMYINWKITPVTHTDHQRVKFKFKGYEKLVLKKIKNDEGEYFNRVFTAYRIYFTSTYVLLALVIQTYVCPGDRIGANGAAIIQPPKL